MLNNKNSLSLSKECLMRLVDYQYMSDDDFKKYVRAICNIHKLEFGINVFYLDYLNNFGDKETEHKKEVFNKMGEFIEWLVKKDEA